MSYKHCTAALGHGSHKISDNVIAVVFIDAQAVFDSDRDVDCVIHGADTVSHKLGLAHEAGTKGARRKQSAHAQTETPSSVKARSSLC